MEGAKRRSDGATQGWMLGLALLLHACAGPGKEAVVERPEPEAAPAYAEVAEAHNGRVERLSRLHGRGVVELRWEQDGSEKFVQGDVEIWIDLPRRTAVRVSKLGDELIWLGSDEDRYWLFDLTGDEPTLLVADHAVPLAAFGPTAMQVRPLALLDLMGLVPLPDAPQDQPPPVWDRQARAWTFEVASAGGPARLLLREAPWWPIAVAVLEPGGPVALSSTLRDYEPVESAGVSQLAWPRMAQVIAIGDAAGSGQMKLFLRRLTTVVDDATIDRLCNLEALESHLRPARREVLRADEP